MPRAKKAATPRPYVWMIQDPETGRYFKKTPSSKYHRWVRIPYAFTSETHLMHCIEWLRITNPDAQVIPYSLELGLSTGVLDYGV